MNKELVLIYSIRVCGINTYIGCMSKWCGLLLACCVVMFVVMPALAEVEVASPPFPNAIKAQSDVVSSMSPVEYEFNITNIPRLTLPNDVGRLSQGQISLSEATEIAFIKAKYLIGDDASLGSVVRVYDPSGNLYAYDFDFTTAVRNYSEYGTIVREHLNNKRDRIKERHNKDIVKSEHHSSFIERMSDNNEDWCYVVVSATYNAPPIRASGLLPSAFYTTGWMAAQLADKAAPGGAFQIERMYFLDPYDRWFEFYINGRRIFVSGRPPYTILDLDDFGKLILRTSQESGLISEDDLKRVRNINRDKFDELNIMPQGSRSWTMIDYWEYVRPMDWSYGCTPTSGAMVLDWWDNVDWFCLLNYWNFERFDSPVDNDWDYSVATVHKSLMGHMGTDVQNGGTSQGDVGPGLRDCVQAHGNPNYSFTLNTCTSGWPHGNDWCWEEIVDEISAGRPFIWSTDFGWGNDGWPWGFGGSGHSTCAVGYDDNYKDVILYRTWDGYRHAYHYSGSALDDMQVDAGSPGGRVYYDAKLTSPRGVPYGIGEGELSSWEFDNDGIGEEWRVGESHTITWNNYGYPGTHVNIFYSTSGGEDASEYIGIVQTDDDGEYEWTPPCDAITDKARILIQQYNGSTLVSSDGSIGNYELIECGILNPPDLQSPSNGSTCRSTSGTLDWSNVSGASQYQVQIGTSCGSGGTYQVTSSSYDYSGLSAGTTYYWRVRTRNACNNWGSWSGCWSFTTAPGVLAAPSLGSPSNGSTCQPTNGTLDWSNVSGASQYQVQIGTSCGSGGTYQVTSSSYDYSGLSAGTTYYWRVRTRNACNNWGSWSGCWSFTTDPGPLAAPSLGSPSDGVNCQPTSGMLDWSNVSGATRYEVQIGTSCGSGSSYQQTSSSYDYSGLSAGTTYYWRVRTRNVCNNWGGWSSCYSFTTSPGTLATPTAPDLSPNPATLYDDVIVSWALIPSATEYRVFRNGVLISGDITTPPFTVPAPAGDGDYGISAGNACGWTDIGQTTSLVVVGDPICELSADIIDITIGYFGFEPVEASYSISNTGEGILSGSISCEYEGYSFSPNPYSVASGESQEIVATYTPTGCRDSDYVIDIIDVGPTCGTIQSIVQSDCFYLIETDSDTIHFYVDVVGETDAQELMMFNFGCGEPCFYILGQPQNNPEFFGSGSCLDHGENVIPLQYAPVDAGNDTIQLGLTDFIATCLGVPPALPILIGHGPPLGSQVRYVSTSGSDSNPGTIDLPFATIQYGLDASASGDTVLAYDGTYAGPGNRDLDFRGKAVTLASISNDPLSCVIDCQGSAGDPHYGFWFHSGEDTTSVIQGFTVTGAYPAEPAFAAVMGCCGPFLEVGAEYNTGTATLRNCRIVNNTGDGLSSQYPEQYAPDLYTFRLSDCVVSDNTGCGYSILNGDQCYSPIERCIFNDNGAAGLQFLSYTDASIGCEVVIHDTEICGNGGIGVEGWGPYYFKASLVNCTISDNNGWGVSVHDYLLLDRVMVSSNDDGGVRAHGISDGMRLAINDTDVQENSGDGIYVTATGIVTSLDELRLVDNTGSGLKIDNQNGSGTDDWSGLIVCGNGSDGLTYTDSNQFGHSHTLRIINTTIADNGIYGVRYNLFGNSQLEFQNTIIAYNTGNSIYPESGSLHPVFQCTDLVGNGDGGLDANWPLEIRNQYLVDGNTRLDPLFCDRMAGDYTLLETSPCLDDNNASCGDIGALGLGCTADVLSIATVKAYDPGTGMPVSVYINDQVTVEGVVFVERGTFSAGGMYLTDDTGGLNFYNSRPALDVSAGDRVRITGPLYYDGNYELYIGWPGAMLIAYGPVPEPTLYSIPNLLADYEHIGDFVAVYGEVETKIAESFTLHQGGHTIEVIIDADTGVSIAEVDIGEVWRVAGPCFNAAGVMWLSPRNQEDLVYLDGTEPTEVHEVPFAYRLHDCVPNPFNPMTTIKFDLPVPAAVELKIYDVAGHEITTLVGGVDYSPGQHHVIWNGQNREGKMAPAGVYFCRLDAGKFSNTKRMTLVR